MTAPDKIWVEAREGGRLCVWDYDNGQAEYTRSDLIPAMLAEARAEGIREVQRLAKNSIAAERECSVWIDNGPASADKYSWDHGRDHMAKQARLAVDAATQFALADTPTPTPARPDYMDGSWYVWVGGDCPVPPETVVESISWAGCTRRYYAKMLNWSDDTAQNHVVRFRVVKPSVQSWRDVCRERNGPDVCDTEDACDRCKRIAAAPARSNLGGPAMTDMRERIAKIIAVHSLGGKDGFVLNSTAVADAIIAALPGMVKPLEWDELGDKWGTVTCGRVQITRRGCDPHWDLSCSSAGSDGYFNSLEAAKAAAEAHYRAQIMAAFGVKSQAQEAK